MTEREERLPPIGVEPHPFTVEELLALEEIKLELLDGVLTGDVDMRRALLRALLANVGLREVVRMAPAELWREALGMRQ